MWLDVFDLDAFVPVDWYLNNKYLYSGTVIFTIDTKKYSSDDPSLDWKLNSKEQLVANNTNPWQISYISYIGNEGSWDEWTIEIEFNKGV